jgi:hypothetical protein
MSWVNAQGQFWVAGSSDNGAKDMLLAHAGSVLCGSPKAQAEHPSALAAPLLRLPPLPVRVPLGRALRSEPIRSHSLENQRHSSIICETHRVGRYCESERRDSYWTERAWHECAHLDN